MIPKLIGAFAAFSVATVITQSILFGYFLSRGTVNVDTATKIVALLNGIDISGNQLRQIMRDGEDREQPDFDEILEARKLDSFDMDLRVRSQQEFRDELSTLLAEVQDKTRKFTERRDAFLRELQEIKEGAQKDGLNDVQRTLQALDPAQAKEQLLIMFDNERIDDVVTMVQAMPLEKRSEILAAFQMNDQNENLKLAEILRRIGEGEPKTSTIDKTSDEL